jgi:hypothetical protein
MMLRVLWGVDELHLKILAVDWHLSAHVAEVKGTRDHLAVLARVHGRELDGRLGPRLHIVHFLLASRALVVGVEVLQPGQFFVEGVEGVFVLLTVVVDDLGGAVVELLFDFVVAVEDFFEVLFRYIGVTALVHDSFDCCFGCGIHQCQLDQHEIRGIRQDAELHECGLD